VSDTAVGAVDPIGIESFKPVAIADAQRSRKAESNEPELDMASVVRD